MWARGSAIRPVPQYAVVGTRVLTEIERELAADNNPDLEAAFERFERTQPEVSEKASSVLGRPLDETALALGYFLVVAVWMAFERSFGSRLREVTPIELAAANDALNLEEELRARHAEEPLELDDVIAQEQPALLTFVHEHLEAALERTDERDIDVDDVHVVYRTVLVEVLALSYAVTPPPGEPEGEAGRSEILA